MKYKLCSLLLVPWFLAAEGSAMEPEDATAQRDALLGTEVSRIPEPMFFDLVRPLGAQKGELEMNALVGHQARSGDTEWAPEVEYVLADGYAVELEFPFENSTLAQYKVAVQGTLGVLAASKMIHGWQVIGRRTTDRGHYSGDALYINAYRFSDRWSTLNMVGLRRTAFASTGQTVGLLNTNLFYNRSREVVLGLEINTELKSGRWNYRLLPQVHVSMGAYQALQVGLGVTNINPYVRREPLGSLRWIYAF
jgi:hypothetical protein